MAGRIVAGILTGSTILAGLVAFGAAHAADNAMKVCGAKYQAAKTARTLPAGQTWQQFLAACRGGKAPVTARPLAAVAPVKPAAANGARQAAVARERQCGGEWRTAKAAGKVPAGQTWPQYWRQCNARLKG